MRRRTWIAVIALLALWFAVPVGAQTSPETVSEINRPTQPVDLQILAINDFHGHIATTGT